MFLFSLARFFHQKLYLFSPKNLRWAVLGKILGMALRMQNKVMVYLSQRLMKLDGNLKGKTRWNLMTYFQRRGEVLLTVKDQRSLSAVANQTGSLVILMVLIVLGLPMRTSPSAGLKSGTSYYRCNITTAVRELKGVPLRREHLDLLESIPFCGFIKALKDVDSNFLARVMKKDDKTIKCVMARYHKPTGMFILGGKSFKPTKRDVELTFAVVDGKMVIPLTKGDAPRIRPQWLVRCFKGCERKAKWKLTKKDLLDKLVELCPKQDPTSVADVVRLLHCYMLACVFAPKQNTSVSQHLASYVEDISNTKSYDWAGYILKALLSQLNNTTNMKSGGCTMLLLFWICEHVALVQPSTSTRLQFPRCLRWNLRDLYLALEKFGLAELLGGLVNHDKLEMTAAEAVYFKANMRRTKPSQSTTRPKLNLLSYMRNTRVSGNLQKSGSSKRKIVICDKRQATKDKVVSDKATVGDLVGPSKLTKCNTSREREGKVETVIGLDKLCPKLSPTFSKNLALAFYTILPIS